jgi:hypothetical protein
VHKYDALYTEIVFVNFGPSFFQTRYAILNIPKDANATGNSANDTQRLTITWLNKDNTTENQFIIFFYENSTEKRYMIKNISITVTPTNEMFPNINGKLKGYLCTYL